MMVGEWGGVGTAVGRGAMVEGRLGEARVAGAKVAVIGVRVEARVAVVMVVVRVAVVMVEELVGVRAAVGRGEMVEASVAAASVERKKEAVMVAAVVARAALGRVVVRTTGVTTAGGLEDVRATTSWTRVSNVLYAAMTAQR